MYCMYVRTLYSTVYMYYTYEVLRDSICLALANSWHQESLLIIVNANIYYLILVLITL